jgi:hypothetical protein
VILQDPGALRSRRGEVSILNGVPLFFSICSEQILDELEEIQEIILD